LSVETNPPRPVALTQLGSSHASSPESVRVLLSICIPTFNRARYLPETLESLVAQLAPDVELLVYDTGSTDGTLALMQDFISRFPAVRFFHLDERRGIDETLLLLLDEARGEYVWYFGSDDTLKSGAVESVRQRILAAPHLPALVFLNHEIVDDVGRPLIAANLPAAGDRTFPDGRRAAAWLALHLGFVSACIFRRNTAPSRSEASEFIGSLWMGAYLNLRSLASGGPALYLGSPMVRARRNPGNIYDYGEVFCRQASRVFWSARRFGIGWFTLYRAMNRTVRLFHLRFALSRRCDNPAELRRVFPAMLRTCWAYPWFWLLIVPVRLCPGSLARTVRDALRERRARRSTKVESAWPRRQEPARQHGES
jgi:O-antigen biosynthesis alpha-1,3-abequosyltransferase